MKYHVASARKSVFASVLSVSVWKKTERVICSLQPTEKSVYILERCFEVQYTRRSSKLGPNITFTFSLVVSLVSKSTFNLPTEEAIVCDKGKQKSLRINENIITSIVSVT